jgi:hypothetical protein
VEGNGVQVDGECLAVDCDGEHLGDTHHGNTVAVRHADGEPRVVQRAPRRAGGSCLLR